MKTLKNLLIIAAAAIATCFTACNNDSTIGSSIVQDKIAIVIDSAYTLDGRVVENNAVQSRTVSQLIGRINAKGYGRLESDVVTQFMPASQFDTVRITPSQVDSLKLMMAVSLNNIVGDSVVPMGLDVYKLTRLLPSPIYSDFNPADYYDPTPLASSIYNLSVASADTIISANARYIEIKLPVEEGRRLYQEYIDNPATFTSPTAFARFFPGLYLKNSYGSGRIVNVTSTLMQMYYHYSYRNSQQRDTTVYRVGNYFAVTPEIITNNNISFLPAESIDKAIDKGEAIITAPTGTDYEITFPTQEIIAGYRAANSDLNVINSLSFSIPGETITNEFSIAPPQYLLMVLKSKKDKFFAENSLPDNISSFYAQYDSSTGLYSFGDMRSYILDMLDKESISADDCTFTITPVSTTFETSSGYYQTSQVLVGMAPYVAAPVMVRLRPDKAKIKFTYSSQTIGK